MLSHHARGPLFLALCLGAAAAAHGYACQDVISQVALNPNGVVTVYSPGGGLNYAYVFQIGATSPNGVPSDQCKAILAALLAAKTTGGQVQWQYSDNLSCSTHPGWAWLTGWYYGPDLL